jgi:HEAT repeat protein
MGDVRALEGLAAATRDPDENVRCRVAEALGNVGDTRAVAALTALLGDASPHVRRCAATALETLRG